MLKYGFPSGSIEPNFSISFVIFIRLNKIKADQRYVPDLSRANRFGPLVSDPGSGKTGPVQAVLTRYPSLRARSASAPYFGQWNRFYRRMTISLREEALWHDSLNP